MVAPLITPSTFARDLTFNPVPCGINPHAVHTPATLVYEAVVSERVSDTGRLYWYTCAGIECLADAQRQADTYLPIDTDLRDATVAELEWLSGVSVSAVPHEMISVSSRGTWQTVACTCVEGVDHITAVA